MVMKNSILRKNLWQLIRKSLTRYIAIVAIIALGAAIFVGLRTTKSDMIVTGQEYMDRHNMFDLRLINTYGWSKEHVDQVGKMEGVTAAEGILTMDAMVRSDRSAEDRVYKLYAVPRLLNQVYLLGGRMPQAPNECLADGFHATDEILGTVYTVSDSNTQDTLDCLSCKEFTVVGYVSSPLYMDMSRGTTSLGNGSVAGFLYIPEEAFDMDYYTEINVTVSGNKTIYTQAFDSLMEQTAQKLEPMLEPLAEDRFASLKADAEDAYQEGYREYSDGLAEYISGRDEALAQLADAKQQLLDGRAELDENRALLEDGQRQIEEGRKTVEKGLKDLEKGQQTLNQERENAQKQFQQAEEELAKNEKLVDDNLAMVNDGIAQLDSGLEQLDSGLVQLRAGLAQLRTAIELADSGLRTLDTTIRAGEEALELAISSGASEIIISQIRESLSAMKERQEEYIQQKKQLDDTYQEYSAQLEELEKQRDQLQQQRQQLISTRDQLQAAKSEIEAGYKELEAQKENAYAQLDAAQSEIDSGRKQLTRAQAELDKKEKEVAEGLKLLEDGEIDLEKGWEEYRKGEAEAMQELSDAALELSKAQAELSSARNTIDSMEQPRIIILDRNTNTGYLALDNNSDIVMGVSTVFPAFFLLIAALVCITTMTRMVEEERTQIGTLKALGYTNTEIISKYLAYSGSAALIGCGLGVIIGSVVFPLILWQAYGIILHLTPHIKLQVDWPLCILVVTAYTAVNLLVTWYCCRRILRDVPAELIRPKAPTSGKKIFLEYLPFWNRISFLNKVMWRNVFRYTQRLLMMLIGIGGCTALLLTGFGLRDSIVEIVNFQFDEITLYDMEARFSESVDEKDMQKFRDDFGRYVDQIGFFHQSTVEMDFDNSTRDVTLTVGGQELTGFMDFHYENEKVAMPGRGQALLSIGAAEAMGISVGDKVTVRNADMQTLELEISGIFENYVNSHIIVTPDTVAQQWGSVPQIQMAFITVGPNQDAHIASTYISKAENVMMVMICEDLADQVGSMLDALDLVVATVVVCAGALAVIVLYNLTNINITERIREIATIKVLGFRSGESAAYVFKENLLLSGMGCAAGMLGGKFLLEFVMSHIKVDMVWFQARLNWPSYVAAIVLTMLCAVLVDFVLYFRLEKINMAEALKSVE